MYLKLDRFYYRTNYIVGNLYINDVYFCDTLENPEFAINPGDYKFEVSLSPRFKHRCPCLDVPHRSGILIHTGNYPSDTKGSILVGDNIYPGTVLNSTSRFNELLRILKNNKDITCIKIY